MTIVNQQWRYGGLNHIKSSRKGWSSNNRALKFRWIEAAFLHLFSGEPIGGQPSDKPGPQSGMMYRTPDVYGYWDGLDGKKVRFTIVLPF